jgi:putative membrane protein
MKMTNILCALMLGLPVVAVAGPSPTSPTSPTTPAKPANPSSKLSDLDTQMIAHQHAVNQTEIAMGKLAQANGSAAVKKYGATLLKDHTQGDKDITALAKKKGVATIPADTAMSDADKKDQADMTAKMKGMKGADFDRMFLDMMAAAHDREITKISADIAVVTDADLKAALDKTKPVLQSHSDTAKSLQKTVTSSMEKK